MIRGRMMAICLGLATSLSACHSARPGPSRLWVPHTAREVIALTAAAVTGLGFTVTKADTVAHTLTAHRDAVNDGNADFMLCPGSVGGRGHINPQGFRSRVAVSLIARDSAAGASVAVEVTVPVATDIVWMGMGGSEHWNCRSSLMVEATIVQALLPERGPRVRRLH